MYFFARNTEYCLIAFLEQYFLLLFFLKLNDLSNSCLLSRSRVTHSQAIIRNADGVVHFENTTVFSFFSDLKKTNAMAN